MKPSILILVFLYLSAQSKSQDSLYASKIDRLVNDVEEKIINLGPNMFIKNIQFDEWYEEYIVDTVNKKLLRVKSFRLLYDTIAIYHPLPNEPLWHVVSSIQSYTFFYCDNILIKIIDNTLKNLSYYVKDSVFIADEPSGLRAVNAVSTEHDIIKNAWFCSNRYIYRFKELLKE